MAHDPIAYVYDADIHCEDCALKRFGRDESGFITGTDSEGNEVGVVAPWESAGNFDDHDFAEGPYVAGCGTCQRIIECQTSPNAMAELYPMRSLEDIRDAWWQARLDRMEDERDTAALDLKGAGDRVQHLEEAIDDFLRGIRDTNELRAAREEDA